MTSTPADLLAAAAREADITRIVPYRPDMATAEKIEALNNRAAWLEAHYGCRPGDGGTADKLRAGADAMAECERLRAALTDMIEGYEEWDRINGEFVLRPIEEQSSWIQRASRALQGDQK
jgi:hypothetical protein